MRGILLDYYLVYFGVTIYINTNKKPMKSKRLIIENKKLVRKHKNYLKHFLYILTIGILDKTRV